MHLRANTTHGIEFLQETQLQSIGMLLISISKLTKIIKEKILYLGILDLIMKSMITFLQQLKREGDLILMNRMEELVGVVLIKHHTLSLHLDMYKTS